MLLSDQAECKSTIHWLCDYVTYQANKKATHHSRDLHSMIVAAFSCLQSWIMSHPWLLDSQVCRDFSWEGSDRLICPWDKVRIIDLMHTR